MKHLLILLCLSSSFLTYAQVTKSKNASFNLREVAMLSIEPNNNAVLLSLNAPNEAGQSAQVVSKNNEKWINFTSAIGKNASKRNLSIKIEYGNVPTGVHLKVATSNYSGNGKGLLGNSTNNLILNKTSQTIVSNIGGAYTGIGENNGYRLIYNLEVYDYKLLDYDNSETLTISLTLTDF
jgi:hypothetical protein